MGGLLLFYFYNGGICFVNDSMSQSATLRLFVTDVYVEDEPMEFHLISLDFWVIKNLVRGLKGREGEIQYCSTAQYEKNCVFF